MRCCEQDGPPILRYHNLALLCFKLVLPSHCTPCASGRGNSYMSPRVVIDSACIVTCHSRLTSRLRLSMLRISCLLPKWRSPYLDWQSCLVTRLSPRQSYVQRPSLESSAVIIVDSLACSSFWQQGKHTSNWRSSFVHALVTQLPRLACFSPVRHCWRTSTTSKLISLSIC